MAGRDTLSQKRCSYSWVPGLNAKVIILREGRGGVGMARRAGKSATGKTLLVVSSLRDVIMYQVCLTFAWRGERETERPQFFNQNPSRHDLPVVHLIL